jgi:hypothetical protein
VVCPRVECQLGGLRLSVASLFSLARTDVPARAGEGSHVSLCSNEYTLRSIRPVVSFLGCVNLAARGARVLRTAPPLGLFTG